MGLKKKTGLGMATLIIAANIPDIDAFATLLSGQAHLGFRRGITHGPGAMIVLPIILTGIMIWFDGWQEKRGKRPADRPPLHKGWLLALAFIGTLSHPALDWMNNYGVRLLEPFSSEWYYGDTLFIIDIWIWLALGFGVWLSFRREKSDAGNWRNPAFAAGLAVFAYIAANGLISNRAEAITAQRVEQIRGKPAELVVANNLPVMFWARDMHWRGQGEIGSGYFSLLAENGGLELNDDIRPDGLDQIDWVAASAYAPDTKPFLFWARMPYLDRADGKIWLRDQRFGFVGVGDRFKVDVTPPE